MAEKDKKQRDPMRELDDTSRDVFDKALELVPVATTLGGYGVGKLVFGGRGLGRSWRKDLANAKTSKQRKLAKEALARRRDVEMLQATAFGAAPGLSVGRSYYEKNRRKKK